MPRPDRMSPLEWRASIGLAGIFGLRMLGLFIILPVFALYAERLPGGADHTLVGIALGAYGLTQALLQIPFGRASDRYGRKPVLYLGLALFAAGSFVAAAAQDIYLVILGRVIQGTGAISAVVIAMTADLTREQHRTKAMALIGMTIGVSFALSMVAGPALNRWIGVPGIFALTGVLALAAMVVVHGVLPTPAAGAFPSDAQARPGQFLAVLKDAELLRLNLGIFVLHAVLMALFVLVPFALRDTGLAADRHWQVYLPVMLGAFALMVPPIILGEMKLGLKPVFVAAVALLLASQLVLGLTVHRFWGICLALTLFFTAFNVLEASLPSLVSRIAPAGARGTAVGVYSSVQFLGSFAGGALGGFISQRHGASGVLIFCSLLTLTWLLVAAGMRPPPAVRVRTFRVPAMAERDARRLSQQLVALPGVHEAVVLAAESVVHLKVEKSGFDEQGVLRLIEALEK